MSHTLSAPKPTSRAQGSKHFSIAANIRNVFDGAVLQTIQALNCLSTVHAHSSEFYIAIHIKTVIKASALCCFQAVLDPIQKHITLLLTALNPTCSCVSPYCVVLW